MELAPLFNDNAKLDGSKNYIIWRARVQTLLERDEVSDELNFARADDNNAIDDTGHINDGDTIAPQPHRTTQEIHHLKIKAKSIFQLMGKGER